MLQFTESARKIIIDQLLDLYNRYMELCRMSGDIQFRLEAEMIMRTLYQNFSNQKNNGSEGNIIEE